MLYAVSLDIVERVYSFWDQIVGIELAQFLQYPSKSARRDFIATRRARAYFVKRTQFDALGILLPFLFGCRVRHVTTPCVDRLALLLALHFGMDAKVLARRKTDPEEVTVVDAIRFFSVE